MQKNEKTYPLHDEEHIVHPAVKGAKKMEAKTLTLEEIMELRKKMQPKIEADIQKRFDETQFGGIVLNTLTEDQLRSLREDADFVLQRKKNIRSEKQLAENKDKFVGKWLVEYDRTLCKNYKYSHEITCNATFYHIKNVNYSGTDFINADFDEIRVYLDDNDHRSHLLEHSDDLHYVELEVYENLTNNIHHVNDLKETTPEEVKKLLTEASVQLEKVKALVE